MNTHTSLFAPRKSKLAWLTAFAVFGIGFSSAALADEKSALLDDFSDAAKTSVGADRFLIDDSTVGGGSTLSQSYVDGVLSASGTIDPARGQPGWVSVALLTSPMGTPVDLSEYEGILIRIHVKRGNVSISANSTDVTNFDYHTVAIPGTSDTMKEIRIPFKDMKRMWSEQTKLNTASIVSLSLVAADFQKGEFAYDVDEVRFY